MGAQPHPLVFCDWQLKHLQVAMGGCVTAISCLPCPCVAACGTAGAAECTNYCGIKQKSRYQDKIRIFFRILLALSIASLIAGLSMFIWLLLACNGPCAGNEGGVDPSNTWKWSDPYGMPCAWLLGLGSVCSAWAALRFDFRIPQSFAIEGAALAAPLGDAPGIHP